MRITGLRVVRRSASALAGCAVAWIGLVPAYAQGNLIQNSSFEQRDAQGVPSEWDFFVLPNESANARISDNASAGRYSVSLSNAHAYERDPANNWSQTIPDDLSGRRLSFEAQIKSSEAGEAAVWLQCFRASPLQLIAAVSTSYTMSVVGTTDWTPVHAELLVPQGTDFLVIRCVLRGTGEAWFDDLSLYAVDDAAPAPVIEVSAAGAAPTVEADVAAQMIESAVLMQEALNQLQSSNEQLDNQIRFLQEEIELLREELRSRGENPTPSPTPTATSEPLDRPGVRLAPGQHVLIPRASEEGN